MLQQAGEEYREKEEQGELLRLEARVRRLRARLDELGRRLGELTDWTSCAQESIEQIEPISSRREESERGKESSEEDAPGLPAHSVRLGTIVPLPTTAPSAMRL